MDTNRLLLQATTTDEDGSYEFTGLPVGEYIVLQRQPVDFEDGIDQRGESGEKIPAGLNGPGIDELMANLAFSDEVGIDDDISVLGQSDSRSAKAQAPLDAASVDQLIGVFSHLGDDLNDDLNASQFNFGENLSKRRFLSSRL